MLAQNVIISEKCLAKQNTIDIFNIDSKPYYVLTDYLDKESIQCFRSKKVSSSGKSYMACSFSLKGNLVDKLNEFKKGITNRIKYRTIIPEYEDQKSYILNLKTIKIDDEILFSNIIEFENKKNNFSYSIVSKVLALCKYKLLLKIESLSITHTNVYFNIRLVRIYPESLDTLPDDIHIHIYNNLNSVIIDNINRYEKLIKFDASDAHKCSKQHVRDRLKKLFKK
jgi:hypothetical protein